MILYEVILVILLYFQQLLQQVVEVEVPLEGHKMVYLEDLVVLVVMVVERVQEIHPQ